MRPDEADVLSERHELRIHVLLVGHGSLYGDVGDDRRVCRESKRRDGSWRRALLVAATALTESDDELVAAKEQGMVGAIGDGPCSEPIGSPLGSPSAVVKARKFDAVSPGVE